MNFEELAGGLVSGRPWRFRNCASLGLTIVCNNITPSLGRAAIGHLEEAVVAVTRRSTRRRRSTRCGQPVRRTAPIPAAAPSWCACWASVANTFSTWETWFSLNVRPMTLTSLLFQSAIERDAGVRSRCREASSRASDPACPATDRSWRSAPLPASCQLTRNTHSYRSAWGQGKAGRTRPTGRSAPGRSRNAA